LFEEGHAFLCVLERLDVGCCSSVKAESSLIVNRSAIVRDGSSTYPQL